MPTYSEIRKKRKENVIFVIDDDNFIRALAIATLSTYGNIVEFTGSDGVLSMYKEKIPNIIFLDIHLSGTNGIDLLKELKSHDPSAFIYMLSSDSTKKNIVDAINMGAEGFIGKPFSRGNFRDALEKCPSLKQISTFQNINHP